MKNNPKEVCTMDCKFVVSFSKIYLFITVPVFLLMAAGGIYKLIFNDYAPINIIVLIFVFVMIAMIFSSVFCFSAKVYDTEIVYRTRMYRKYRIKLSDISSVKCEKEIGLKYGNKYYLYIVSSAVPNKVFKFDADMRNFDKLSGFLLEKAKNGEIQPAAVSPKYMNELKK